MKQKFCFFDFDDTLIHGSSGTMLIRYYLKKHPLGVIYLIPMAIVCILYVLKLASFNQAKSATLFPLNRMSEREVQAFFIVSSNNAVLKLVNQDKNINFSFGYFE